MAFWTLFRSFWVQVNKLAFTKHVSGDLGPHSKPFESARILSAEPTGLEIGPERDGILGGCALNLAGDIGHLSLCSEVN